MGAGVPADATEEEGLIDSAARSLRVRRVVVPDGTEPIAVHRVVVLPGLDGTEPAAVRRVVVLPGLDGTGLLQDEFRDALARDAAVTLLTYPTDDAQDFATLTDAVAAQLPADEPFVLVGESFGGPLAIALAARRPPALAGLVLAAAFARYPVAALRALAPFARFAAVRAVPMRVVAALLLGRWATPANRAELAAAHARVAPAVFRRRLRDVLALDTRAALAQVEVPVLCLRAARDRLVPASAAATIVQLRPGTRVVDIDGPHCLLEAEPAACADAIREFLVTL